MEPGSANPGKLLDKSKRFARRLLAIGENRFELLMVEVQEERERLLHAILLALGVATFGFLTGMVMTGTIVVALWELSPMAALLALTSLYGVTAFSFYLRLKRLLRDWHSLPSTREQFRKDRQCLEANLT